MVHLNETHDPSNLQSIQPDNQSNYQMCIVDSADNCDDNIEYSDSICDADANKSIQIPAKQSDNQPNCQIFIVGSEDNCDKNIEYSDNICAADANKSIQIPDKQSDIADLNQPQKAYKPTLARTKSILNIRWLLEEGLKVQSSDSFESHSVYEDVVFFNEKNLTNEDRWALFINDVNFSIIDKYNKEDRIDSDYESGSSSDSCIMYTKFNEDRIKSYQIHSIMAGNNFFGNIYKNSESVKNILVFLKGLKRLCVHQENTPRFWFKNLELAEKNHLSKLAAAGVPNFLRTQIWVFMLYSSVGTSLIDIDTSIDEVTDIRKQIINVLTSRRFPTLHAHFRTFMNEKDTNSSSPEYRWASNYPLSMSLGHALA
ncbi:hypothetical protein BB561_001795 [Smittium simulii]|uniref:Uncharacterized protein n=1 Tax=Smittium simulii TaxID=133385 RepID=A0A2T9YT05_9FUNG|nr:hypothetical protein BB561_001795 [Smittium simulii]